MMMGTPVAVAATACMRAANASSLLAVSDRRSSEWHLNPRGAIRCEPIAPNSSGKSSSVTDTAVWRS